VALLGGSIYGVTMGFSACDGVRYWDAIKWGLIGVGGRL
jgi:hypothetical protein